MKCLSLFTGIGGFDLALRNAGHEIVGACEIDDWARRIYAKHFPGVHIYRDATQINASELPDFDLLVAGFPCQTFSIAGNRLGFEESRGTLFFEIARIAKQKRPRLLLLENVKGLLSHDGGKTFAVILATLDELGYDAEWQVLNSKYFVPQNRERIFIIGHLRGQSCPQVFPLGYSHPGSDKSRPEAQGDGPWVQDQCSGTIDANYWKGVGTRTHIAEPKINTVAKVNKGQSGLVSGTDGISRTVTQAGGGRHGLVSGPEIKKIGNISKTKHDSHWGRVYDPDGVGPALSAEGGGLGAKTGLIAWSKSTRSPGKVEHRTKTHEANTLATGEGCRSQASANFVAMTERRTEEAKEIRKENVKKGRDYNSRRDKELALRDDDLSNCVTSTQGMERFLTNGTKIRRLTPLECERLQGFPDDYTKTTIDGTVVSDTQRYKMCGNAVTVNVIAYIMEYLK